VEIPTVTKTKTPGLLAALICASMFALSTASAKLPAPSEEAKAKAAEAAAKTAHGGKVDNYKLCKSMEATAAAYYANAKKAGKETKPPVATPPCADPGPFVYTPAAPTVAAAAPAPAAAPAAPAAPKK
jgi:hypothetical protein